MTTDLAPALGADRLVDDAPVDLPDYLRRYYAWAYVWPLSVWFCDHQPIINAILFGNYRRIMRNALRLIDPETAGKTLQIAGVYGELTPTLMFSGIDDLHLIDAAPIQLEAARRKLGAIGKFAHLGRMFAENLRYNVGTFDTALMFLLLHEMPPSARRAALAEAMRVLRPGGRLVIAEDGECRKRHLFHRFAPDALDPHARRALPRRLLERRSQCRARRLPRSVAPSRSRSTRTSSATSTA